MSRTTGAINAPIPDLAAPKIVVDEQELAIDASIADAQIGELLRTAQVNNDNRVRVMCRTALNESLRGTQIQACARSECAELWRIRQASGSSAPGEVDAESPPVVVQTPGASGSIARQIDRASHEWAEKVQLRRQDHWTQPDFAEPHEEDPEEETRFDKTQFSEYEPGGRPTHDAPHTTTPIERVPTSDAPASEDATVARPLAIGFASFPCPMCHLPIVAQDARGGLHVPWHRMQTPSFPFGHGGPMFRAECPASMMELTQVCDGSHQAPSCDDHECWHVQSAHPTGVDPGAPDGGAPTSRPGPQRPLLELVSPQLRPAPMLVNWLTGDSEWDAEDQTSEAPTFDQDKVHRSNGSAVQGDRR